MTELITAIYKIDITRIKQILEKEKSTEKSDYNAALRTALFLKHIEIAQLLVSAGADVNTTTPTEPPLISMCLMSPEATQIVSFLLDNHVNIDFNLYKCCVMISTPEILKLILKYKSVADLEWRELFLLCLNTAPFNIDIAKALLEFKPLEKFSHGLFQAIYFKNHTAIQFLCENGVDINLKNNMNISPLAYAVQNKNFEAATILIQKKANPLSLSIQDITEVQKDQSKEAREFVKLFNKTKSALKIDKAFFEQLYLEDMQNISLEMITENNDIEKSIHEHLIYLLEQSGTDKELVDKIKQLLSEKVELKVKNITLVPFVAELATILLHPERIDQKDTNLCGPSAFTALLAGERPQMFLDMGIELLTTGKTLKPLSLSLSSYSINKASSFLEIFLTEIRRSSNLTGYSPISFREDFQGLTAARTIVNWLQACAVGEIEDLTLPETVRGTRPSTGLYFLLNALFLGFHSKNYRALPKPENLDYVIEQIRVGKQAILLISGDWMDHLKSLENHLALGITSVSHKTTKNYCCFSFDHYVFLTHLAYKEQQVEYQFMTWGKKYQGVETLQNFLKHYRGAIIVNPGEPLRLENSLQAQEKSLDPAGMMRQRRGN